MPYRQKAMRPAWLAKIPPLACGQSAPFDKGVYTTGPARLAANAIPENRFTALQRLLPRRPVKHTQKDMVPAARIMKESGLGITHWRKKP